MEIPEETLVLDPSKKPLEHPGVIYSRLHEKIWKTSGIAGTFHLADRVELMGFHGVSAPAVSSALVVFVLISHGHKTGENSALLLGGFPETVPVFIGPPKSSDSPSILPLIHPHVARTFFLEAF